ncbi:MAG TPA: peptide-methionine (S)-S-oxide reductase MsrA [Thermoanaerobaculia bacterium]
MSPDRRRPAPTAVLALALLAVLACGPARGNGAVEEAPAAAAEARGDLAAAVFAGGCFWCMEPPFDDLPGVVSTTSGYTGGEVEDPSYEEVSAGRTGHAEAVRVVYDPEEVTYEELLHVFWRNVDPTDAGGQFCDRGSQYRSGIFVASEEERRLAEASKAEVEERLGKPVVTAVETAGPFYAAEDYHQDYYEKNPIRYKIYRTGCGRDGRLRAVWGDEAGGGH